MREGYQLVVGMRWRNRDRGCGVVVTEETGNRELQA